MKVEPPHKIVVDGREWKEFLLEFDGPDGTFGFSIMAISHDHAVELCEDMKKTVRVLGESGGKVCL